MEEPDKEQPIPELASSRPLGASESEDEALARVRREGQSALASEFMRQRHRLRRMIEVRLDRRVATRVDASDVLQEAFLEASRRLDEYLAHPPMPLFLWLRYLTGQRILAIHRQHLGAKKRDPRQEVPMESVRRPEADSASLSVHLVDQLSTPSRMAIRQELHVRVEQVIAELEPLDREILALRHFEQLTNQEAAEELGISPAAASKRYIRGLEKLREVLKTLPGVQS